MSRRRGKSLTQLIKTLPGYDPYAQAGDCRFYPQRAYYYIDFFETYITHLKGPLAGKPYKLADHEKAIMGNLFGWYRPDGVRRYSHVFYFIPRGNSKTTFCAGLLITYSICDDEIAQENYSTAWNKEQASYIFDTAASMIRADEELNHYCEIYAKSIIINGQTYKPLARVQESAHGFNVSLAINDEIHTHANGDFLDVIDTGLNKRPQPIRFDITTSDYNREGSPCNQLHKMASDVRDNIFNEPGFLPAIFEVSTEDLKKDPECWKKPEFWYKANPGLGTAIPYERFEKQFRKAEQYPAETNKFKRLHLNIRTESFEAFFKSGQWAASGTSLDIRKFYNKRIAGMGLDLGYKSDFSSFCIVFDTSEKKDEVSYAAFWWFWTPDHEIEVRQMKHIGAEYIKWNEQKYIKLTKGNVTSYRAICKEIANDILPRFKWEGVKLALDMAFQGHTVNEILTDDYGVNVIPFVNSFNNMAVATKEMGELVSAKRLNHGNNPIMQWQSGFLVVHENSEGKYKPDKEKSDHKIDGFSAVIMAIAMAMQGSEDTTSGYEEHGIRSL